jgi:hypothetical protein
MPKPLVHAEIDANKFGGVPEDYQAIHDFFDSSKATFGDNRHRAILHTTFGIYLAERVFGTYIVNSAGKKISVREIGESHILVDFGGKFIPTPQDFLQEMEFKDWMQNGKGSPPSCAKLFKGRKRKLEDGD